MSNRWRRAVAALANPVRRRVYAEIVAGVPSTVADARRERSLFELREAGLLDGHNRVIETVFADLLAEDAPFVKTGVERFLDGERIAEYPSRPSERLKLLE